MYYSSGCNCGCDFDCGCNTVPSTCCTTMCPTTTTTSTIPCIGEPCDEFYDCECVIYNGPDLSCYGLTNGTSLCDIIELIASNVPACFPTDVCFRISNSGFTTNNCITEASLALWNGKVYYEPKVSNCSSTAGYVYWSGTRWEYANGLGGGTILYAYLPIPSQYPITSPAGPWISVDSTFVIQSSTSGTCPTTTTTTLAPADCPCNCIVFTNSSSSVKQVSYLDCDLNFISLSLSSLQVKSVCGSNPNVPDLTVSYNIGDSCRKNNNICKCYIPTTTTSTTSTTTTTTLPCNCYKINNDYPTYIGSYNYVDCITNTLTPGSIPFGDKYQCARSITLIGEITYTLIGLCQNGCNTTTTSTTSTTTTTSSTTTTTTLPPCNCITFRNLSLVRQAVSYNNCIDGSATSASISGGSTVSYCGSNGAAVNSTQVAISTVIGCTPACTSTTTTSSTTTTTTNRPPTLYTHVLCYDALCDFACNCVVYAP